MGELKRYVLFAGIDFYPSGGWEDFKGTDDDLDLLKQHGEELLSADYDWAHIVDTHNLRSMPTTWHLIGKYWA